MKNKRDMLSAEYVAQSCIGSLDPRVFFEGKASKLRATWVEWWANHPDYFNNYVRVRYMTREKLVHHNVIFKIYLRLWYPFQDLHQQCMMQ